MKPTDLRGILQYIPQFREKTFILAIDGAIITDENFATLLLDVAVLRSLSIRVVLVHGASAQIKALAEKSGVKASNADGSGITDAPTLQLAMDAANRLTHEILEGLSANDLRAVCPNAIIAHPLGIIQGVDHLFTGKVEKVDVELLQTLLAQGIIPVIPPLGFDGDGTQTVNMPQTVGSDANGSPTKEWVAPSLKSIPKAPNLNRTRSELRDSTILLKDQWLMPNARVPPSRLAAMLQTARQVTANIVAVLLISYSAYASEISPQLFPERANGTVTMSEASAEQSLRAARMALAIPMPTKENVSDVFILGEIAADPVVKIGICAAYRSATVVEIVKTPEQRSELRKLNLLLATKGLAPILATDPENPGELQALLRTLRSRGTIPQVTGLFKGSEIVPEKLRNLIPFVKVVTQRMIDNFRNAVASFVSGLLQTLRATAKSA